MLHRCGVQLTIDVDYLDTTDVLGFPIGFCPLHNLVVLLFLATRPPCVFSHAEPRRTKPNQTETHTKMPKNAKNAYFSLFLPPFWLPNPAKPSEPLAADVWCCRILQNRKSTARAVARSSAAGAGAMDSTAERPADAKYL